LIPEHGWPAWFRMPAGAEVSQMSLAEDGAFSIHSWELCLLELVRDPQLARYRIRAEVRHQDSKAPGEVGLFFGLEEIATSKGNVWSFGQLVFNDIDSEEALWERLPMDKALRPPRPKGNRVFLRPFLYGRRADDTIREQRLSESATTCVFQPTRMHGAGTWRSIAVEVTPEKIRAYWEAGAVAGEITNAEWARQLKRALAPDSVPPGTEPAGIAHRGAAGLYVLRSTASFRRVVIEPLDAPSTPVQETP